MARRKNLQRPEIRGAKNHQAKLTRRQVEWMRRRYVLGFESISELANEVRISYRQALRIIRDQKWRSVKLTETMLMERIEQLRTAFIP